MTTKKESQFPSLASIFSVPKKAYESSPQIERFPTKELKIVGQIMLVIDKCKAEYKKAQKKKRKSTLRGILKDMVLLKSTQLAMFNYFKTTKKYLCSEQLIQNVKINVEAELILILLILFETRKTIISLFENGKMLGYSTDFIFKDIAFIVFSLKHFEGMLNAQLFDYGNRKASNSIITSPMQKRINDAIMKQNDSYNVTNSYEDTDSDAKLFSNDANRNSNNSREGGKENEGDMSNMKNNPNIDVIRKIRDSEEKWKRMKPVLLSGLILFDETLQKTFSTMEVKELQQQFMKACPEVKGFRKQIEKFIDQDYNYTIVLLLEAETIGQMLLKVARKTSIRHVFWSPLQQTYDSIKASLIAMLLCDYDINIEVPLKPGSLELKNYFLK